MTLHEQIQQIAFDEKHFSLSYTLEKKTEAYVSYGIKIVMTDLKTKSHSIAVVNDITTEIETAEEIFNMVFNGIVTPITLIEVVEDLICEILLREAFIETKTNSIA